jgi:hypothetical protein
VKPQLQRAGVEPSFSGFKNHSPPVDLSEGGDAACEKLLRCLDRLDDAGINKVGWQDFESHCAHVLERNGYRVPGSVWFRGPDRRYQIDVVGMLLGRVLCIDCKAWKKGGGSSRLMKAAESQKERAIQLERCVSPGVLGDHDGMAFYPLIVTLRSQDLQVHEGVAAVPFSALNTFLVDFDLYQEDLFRV